MHPNMSNPNELAKAKLRAVPEIIPGLPPRFAYNWDVVMLADLAPRPGGKSAQPLHSKIDYNPRRWANI